MTLRRTLTRPVALAAVGALALTACGNGGTEAGDGPQLINDGEIVVAMSGEFRPFSYFESNNLTGFDYDIAAAIADEMGLELKTETAAFASLIQGLQSNRYDALIASMTPTEDRMAVVDFTESYYNSGAQYFVSTDAECESFDISDDSISVGVANGTTYDAYLKDEGFGGDVVSFESDITALEDTETGRLDGAITDRLVGLFQIQEANRDLRACGDPLYDEGPAIAVAKDNPLRDDIDEALATIKENGTYAELSTKWFGEDIS